MNGQQQEELAKALVEMVQQDPVVISAVWNYMCNCPNLTVRC